MNGVNIIFSASCLTVVIINLLIYFHRSRSEYESNSRIIPQADLMLVIRSNMLAIIEEYVKKDISRVSGTGDGYTRFNKLKLLSALNGSGRNDTDTMEIKRLLEQNLYPEMFKRVEGLEEYGNYIKNRGIIVTAHEKMASVLYGALRNLRSLGCSLPIEFVYYSSGPGEQWIRRLETIEKLRAVNITKILDVGDQYIPRSFYLQAILASTFQESVYMDSDVVLMQNPENLFLEPGYLETGTLFFRDRTMKGYSSGDIEYILQRFYPGELPESLKNAPLLRRETHYQMETGLLLIDKRKHLSGILAALELNVAKDHHDVWKYFQPHKEALWIGMEFVGTPYHFSSHRVGAIGVPSSDMTMICGEMAFFSPDGRLQWFLGSLAEDLSKNKTGPASLSHYVLEGSYTGLCLKGDVKRLHDEDSKLLSNMLSQYNL